MPIILLIIAGVGGGFKPPNPPPPPPRFAIAFEQVYYIGFVFIMLSGLVQQSANCKRTQASNVERYLDSKHLFCKIPL